MDGQHDGEAGDGDEMYRGGELLSAISLSGWQDLRVIFQARILTWDVEKADTPRSVPNMPHADTRKQAETLLS